MFEFDDESIYDFSASCTVDVAVAKMLGWMHQHKRRARTQVTEYGISADQLAGLPTLGSLDDQLRELVGAAKRRLNEAADKDMPPEELNRLSGEVLDNEEKLKTAMKYRRSIVDEVAKGEKSELNIDKGATESAGETYITLDSVERWARKIHGVSIDGAQEKSTVSAATADTSGDEQEDDGNPKDPLSRTRADHLFTTFAFLVEAFGATAVAKYGDRGDLNVKAIAERLEALANEANKNEPLKGQSAEAIKGRIEEAMRIKRGKLPSR